MIGTIVLSTVATMTMLYMKTFQSQLLVVAALSIFRAPIGPQVDSVVMAALEDKTTYGTMRLWGAVSFGIFSLIGGVLTQAPTGGSSSTKDGPFMILFFAYGFCFVVAGFLILWIVSEDLHRRAVKAKLKQQRKAQRALLEMSPLSEAPSPSPQSVYDMEHQLLPGPDHASVADLIIVEASSDLLRTPGRPIEPVRERSATVDSVGSDGAGKEVNVAAALRQVVRNNPAVLLFALVVFLSGVGAGAIDSYLFIYLKELGGTGLLMGLARFLTCVAEVPMFQIAGPLQKKYGTWPMIVLTQLAFVVRFVYYTLLVEPWSVLPCELLNGITFAVTWNVSCTYANEISPKDCQSIMQSILEGLHFGIGYGIGSLLGGFGYQYFGAVRLFQFCGMLSFFSALLATFAWKYMDTHKDDVHRHNSVDSEEQSESDDVTNELYIKLSQEDIVV